MDLVAIPYGKAGLPVRRRFRDNGRAHTDARTSESTAMTEPDLHVSIYRLEGGFRLIEIELRDLRQLFNTLDPAPFHERDLDPDAETYIVDALREMGTSQPAKLVIYLPSSVVPTPEVQALPLAVHNYFRFRAAHVGRDLRYVLKSGSASLAIGLGFLVACLSLREFLSPLLGARSRILDEGLLIIGWVALWRPLEVFLYDWWPIRRRQSLLRRLAVIPIDIRSR